MSRTTMSAWYMATCVNAPCPVTSPTAQSRSPARSHSSVSRKRSRSSSPTLARPRSPRLAALPVLQHQRELLPVMLDPGRLGAGADGDLVAAQRLGGEVRGLRLLHREQPV